MLQEFAVRHPSSGQEQLRTSGSVGQASDLGVINTPKGFAYDLGSFRQLMVSVFIL